jgi:hypothetical protein
MLSHQGHWLRRRLGVALRGSTLDVTLMLSDRALKDEFKCSRLENMYTRGAAHVGHGSPLYLVEVQSIAADVVPWGKLPDQHKARPRTTYASPQSTMYL